MVRGVVQRGLVERDGEGVAVPAAPAQRYQRDVAAEKYRSSPRPRRAGLSRCRSRWRRSCRVSRRRCCAPVRRSSCSARTYLRSSWRPSLPQQVALRRLVDSPRSGPDVIRVGRAGFGPSTFSVGDQFSRRSYSGYLAGVPPNQLQRNQADDFLNLPLRSNDSPEWCRARRSRSVSAPDDDLCQ